MRRVHDWTLSIVLAHDRGSLPARSWLISLPGLTTSYLANWPKETLGSMTSTTPPRDWTDIHWPEISEAETARWIAVLPLAATEQHGPHLPLGTDIMIAQAYLARTREFLAATIPVTF